MDFPGGRTWVSEMPEAASRKKTWCANEDGQSSRVPVVLACLGFTTGFLLLRWVLRTDVRSPCFTELSLPRSLEYHFIFKRRILQPVGDGTCFGPLLGQY